MANELVIHYPTGATLYALLFDATGQIYNGSTFAAPGSASWTDYDIAMTEAATATGVYRASMPAVAAGAYGWVVRKQAGASPAVGDISVGTGTLQWTGSAELVLNDILVDTGTTLPATLATLATAAALAVVDANVDAILVDTTALTGGGVYSYSNTVDDGSGNLLDGVLVELATDSGFTNIVNFTHTNALGAFSVYSDTAGTHYVRLQLAGYTFTNQTVTLA